MTGDKWQLKTRSGSRIDVMSGNNMIGYAEDDILYAIKNDYAELVGPINHRVEIIPKLSAWRNTNSL